MKSSSCWTYINEESGSKLQKYIGVGHPVGHGTILRIIGNLATKRRTFAYCNSIHFDKI